MIDWNKDITKSFYIVAICIIFMGIIVLNIYTQQNNQHVSERLYQDLDRINNDLELSWDRQDKMQEYRKSNKGYERKLPQIKGGTNHNVIKESDITNYGNGVASIDVGNATIIEIANGDGTYSYYGILPDGSKYYIGRVE